MKLVIVISFIFVTQFSWAKDNKKVDHKNHSEHKHMSGEKHDHKNSTATLKKMSKDKLVIKVKGMVCAFCAQGITKNFNKLSSVKETKVDLETMEVTLKLNKGKELPEDVIKKVVTDAGFSYVGTK